MTIQYGDPRRDSHRSVQIRCPNCHNPVDVAADASFEAIECNSCDSEFSLLGDALETRDPEVVILGHFELLERLGTGAFGTVWKARDTDLDRIVAVKIPRKGESNTRELEKFMREARASAQLKHPNIVSVHEIGRTEDTVYIVSELVEGVTLSDWLSAKQTTAREASELCIKIAGALEHSHQAGVVHRDLKPQNILIDGDGEPHVADFGLARREIGEVTMTLQGQVLGTPAYMSPEQARGEGHQADNRSDIYSLGVVLYRLLTGERPFRGNSIMLIHQVLHDEPPAPRKLNHSIPRDLETICLKCMEKDPSKRYQCAAEVVAELQRFLGNEPIQARPLGKPARAWRWCKRNPSVAGLLAAVVCTLLIGLLVSWNYYMKEVETSATLAAVSTKLLTVADRQQQGKPRTEGYREEMWRLITDSRRSVEADLLRSVAVGAMGDFVGLPPTDHDDYESHITAMAMHPRGNLIAVGLKNGEIRFAEPRGQVIPEKLETHSGSLVGLEFSADGSQLISVDNQGIVLLHHHTSDGNWQAQSKFEIETGEAVIRSVRFTPDLKDLLTRTDHEAALWELREETSGPPLARQELQESESVRGVVVSSNNRWLGIGYSNDKDADGIIKDSGYIIRDSSSSMSRRVPLPAYGVSAAHSMAFSCDGKYFVYGAEAAIALYRVEQPQGNDLPEFTQKFLLRSDAIRGVAFSRDNQFLATVDIRGRLSVLTVSNGKEIAMLSHPRNTPTEFQFLTFSADGSFLASANHDSIKVWHFAGVTERKVLAGHPEPIPDVAFSPDGERLASASKDGTVCVWNPKSGEKMLTLGTEPFPGMVQCVVFSPKGGLLAIAYWGREDSNTERTVQVWDVQQNELIAATHFEFDEVARMVFIDDKRLAASGTEGLVVWDLEETNGEIRLKRRYEETGNRCLSVAASSDGRFLAWAAETRIRVRDLDANEAVPIDEAPRMYDGWHGLAFLPETNYLIYVSSQGDAEIWDVENNESHVSFGNINQFRAPHIALSNDGRWFAGLVEPTTVGVWDTKTRKQLFSLRPERAAIWSLAWSRDAKRLALGLSDGGLTVWDFESINNQLAEFGLNWRGITATPSE